MHSHVVTFLFGSCKIYNPLLDNFVNNYFLSFFFQLTCGDLQSISQPTVCNIIGQMADQISDHCGRFIGFPNNEELRQKHVKFFNIGRFPGVSGVIDCTHFEISSPGGDNAENFRNRKGYFSLNVQFIAGPDMDFYNIVARWPGSAHDTRIFDSSYVKTQFEQGVHRGMFYFLCQYYLIICGLVQLQVSIPNNFNFANWQIFTNKYSAYVKVSKNLSICKVKTVCFTGTGTEMYFEQMHFLEGNSIENVQSVLI